MPARSGAVLIRIAEQQKEVGEGGRRLKVTRPWLLKTAEADGKSSK